MHYNSGFLNGTANPLCQRGHFPLRTKLISIPHHPIMPPHRMKQPTFSGAAAFLVLCMYDKADAHACLCEMCGNAGWRHAVATANTV